jgi:hypothetical protein
MALLEAAALPRRFATALGLAFGLVARGMFDSFDSFSMGCPRALSI